MARRRKRRTNPKNNHSGLGALIGSAIGATPGALARSGGLAWVGSIAGGAIGGAIGAKEDRRKRGSAGGAIGGALLGPIGAGIGGYVGGRRADAKKTNPAGTTVALAIGVGIAAVGAGYGAYRLAERRKAKKAKELPGAPNGLAGVVANATLHEAPFMVEDIMQPILLQTPADPLPIDDEFDRVENISVQIVRPSGETTIEQPAGVAFGVRGEIGESEKQIVLVEPDGDLEVHHTSDKAIAYLITGLSPESAQLAYELALVHIADKNVDWADPQARDAATMQILTSIAPKVDWSQGLRPYSYGSAHWKAWVGVQTVGTVANQSIFNKRALAELQEPIVIPTPEPPPGQ